MGDADDMELIYSLIGYPNETEWIEFKEGNSDLERIGRDISALANVAAYLGRPRAYKIWGVEDDTHALVGTQFDPYHAKGKGNQDLQIWLRLFLSLHASYEFRCIERNGLRFVVLEIDAAVGQPVCFDKAPFIREGSSTVRLQPGSAKEARLWERLQAGDFELKIAGETLSSTSCRRNWTSMRISAYSVFAGRRPLRAPCRFSRSRISFANKIMVDIPF